MVKASCATMSPELASVRRNASILPTEAMSGAGGAVGVDMIILLVAVLAPLQCADKARNQPEPGRTCGPTLPLGMQRPATPSR